MDELEFAERMASLDLEDYEGYTVTELERLLSLEMLKALPSDTLDRLRSLITTHGPEGPLNQLLAEDLPRWVQPIPLQHLNGLKQLQLLYHPKEEPGAYEPITRTIVLNGAHPEAGEYLARFLGQHVATQQPWVLRVAGRVETLKHLPGRHDQRTHAPKSSRLVSVGVNTIRFSDYQSFVAYANGVAEDATLRKGWKHIHALYNLIDRKLYATASGTHDAIMDDLVPSGSGSVGEIIHKRAVLLDSSIRFSVFVSPDADISGINFDTRTAASGSDETRGLGRIYDTMDLLSSVGFPESIKVNIYGAPGRFQGSTVNVETTLKYLLSDPPTLYSYAYATWATGPEAARRSWRQSTPELAQVLDRQFGVPLPASEGLKALLKHLLS